MSAEEFAKGRRVRQPRQAVWGLGEILEDTDLRFVSVIFEDGKPRKMQRNALESVSADLSRSEKLDSFVAAASGNKKKGTAPRPKKIKEARYTFDHLREKFLSLFPEGFGDPEYFGNERNYKLAAREELLLTLGKDEMASLLAKEDFETSRHRSRRDDGSKNCWTIRACFSDGDRSL